MRQYDLRSRSDQAAQEGDDTDGRRVVQEWGWLGKAQTGGRQFVRRITKSLPHGKEISVVTDLWDEVRYPASAMLSAYRSRWGIETVFHQITDVFSLKHLIGTQPKAVLFQLSFCLLLYNTLQVVRAHLASYKGCVAKKISNEKLFYDMKRELVTVNVLVKTETLLSLLGPVPTAAELRDTLRMRLCGAWSDRWWKAPSSGGGGHQKVKTRVPGNHTSTYRALQQSHERTTVASAALQRP